VETGDARGEAGGQKDGLEYRGERCAGRHSAVVLAVCRRTNVIKSRHPRPLMTSHNFPRGDGRRRREKRELTREREREEGADGRTERRQAGQMTGALPGVLHSGGGGGEAVA